MYSVIYYEDGKSCPVIEFMKSRSPKERAKILREIDLLKEFGPTIGMPHVRKLDGTNNLWELRV